VCEALIKLARSIKKKCKVVALNIVCVDMTFLCLQKGVLEEIRSYMCVMIR
jgi:hypothetical protein